jgi:tetratricopeptide (TPR) repeat protein
MHPTLSHYVKGNVNHVMTSLSDFSTINGNMAFKELKLYREAIASYDRAFDLDPDYAFLGGQRLFTRLLSCDWHNIDQEITDICLQISRGRKMALPFQAQGFCSDPLLLQTAACWVADNCPAQPATTLS